MKPDDYAAALTAVNKLSNLAAYEPSVLNWLQSYPCMTAAQVLLLRINIESRSVRGRASVEKPHDFQWR